jgi:hypothetical protein
MNEVDALVAALSQRIGHLTVEVELWKARAILAGYGEESLDKNDELVEDSE